MNIILFIFALVPFYFLGAFPSGYLLAKFYKVDITKQGSGNVGATNVARVLGSKAGLITLILDILKGFLASAAAWYISDNTNYAIACGAAAIAGHCFSIPNVLPHGKGVATSAGVLVFLAPKVLAISFLIFAIIFIWKRIVSLASIITTLALPAIAMFLNEQNTLILLTIFCAVLITYRHKDNIQRYIQGKEKTFSLKKVK